MSLIEKDWHPIFKYMLELFDGPGCKFFYNRDKRITIRVISSIEDYKIVIGLTKRLLVREILRDRGIRGYEERFDLDYRRGAYSFVRTGWTKTLLGESVSLRDNTVFMPSTNHRNAISWRLIDQLFLLVKSSKRLDPGTGEVVTSQRAKELDGKMESAMFNRMEVVANKEI